jgi:hypothetical protein
MQEYFRVKIYVSNVLLLVASLPSKLCYWIGLSCFGHTYFCSSDITFLLTLLFFILSEYNIIKIYKTTILLVVLYGCKTWSLTLTEEDNFRVLESRMLRRIFGPKR